MTSKGDKVKSVCASCAQRTNHIVEAVAATTPDYGDYRYYSYDCVVMCMGCDTKSFYHRGEDHEAAQQDDITGDWEPYISEKYYPVSIPGHRRLDQIASLPEAVGKMYTEAVTAIENRAYALGGVGLRAVVEAVCNHQKIRGRDLQARIGAMLKKHLISKGDSDLLHSVRFMGNDAAHEMKALSLEAVMVGLKVVEHLLYTLYVLKSEADGKLELVVSSFDELKPLLEKKVSTVTVGDKVTFRLLIDGYARRLVDNHDSLEKELIDAITAGTMPGLALDTYDATAKAQQYAVVAVS